MAIKTSVYIGMSLDGFIARGDGSLDWLNDANQLVPEGEDCGYQEFMQSVDVLVMGRNTYETVLTFGDWPYGDTRVIVLSSRSIEFPEDIPPCVEHSSQTPKALLERLTAEGAQHLYIDGGNTVQRFLADGLIDDLIITTIPILLGDGISLFGPVPDDIRLSHVATRTWEFGFVQTHYEVVRASLTA